MKLIRYIGAASVVGTLTFALAGSALADSATVNTTGPNSNQTISTSNTTSVDTTNVNETDVLSANSQGASTGNVSAQDNTTVGGAGSGNASNSSSTSNVITNDNSTAPVQVVTPTAPGVGQGSSTSPAAGSTQPAGQGGSVLGASTGGLGAGAPAILPVTGPTVPVDVSALRAAWHPQVGTSPSSLVKHTSAATAVMLITATLLSLLGAFGSVVYNRRQERRV